MSFLLYYTALPASKGRLEKADITGMCAINFVDFMKGL